ncbi:MAG: AraC family transcriptional regulator [Clostridia bacterium]|nr:AraC family transcriptional regulator [Clostridia bacterium]
MRPSYELGKTEYEKRIKKTTPLSDTPYIRYNEKVVKGIRTCFKERVENGWNFSGEYHDFWELVFVTDGSIYIAIEGKTRKLESGELVFYMPMEFHQMWCEDCDKAKFTVISFDGCEELLNPLRENIIKLNTEKSEELSQVYHSIHDTFDVNLNVRPKRDDIRSIPAEIMCINNLENFLLSLLNEKISDNQAHQSKGNLNYKLIIDAMHENINKNLTMEGLAEICNLSVSNLKKTFRKYGNEGVMKYFNRLKINRAIKFLKRGYTSSQIAREMGFSSQNYFSVVFKRETGMLPSEFKNKNL